jgi:cholesterol oxidase
MGPPSREVSLAAKGHLPTTNLRAAMAPPEQFDAVVIGSGFGGAVTAYRLAKGGLSVCVLERGKPFGPGDFARTPHAMSRNFWDPSQGLQGLYDIWSFQHLEAVVSAGLGGGSLIYANVFIRKDERWFAETRADGSSAPWPVTREELDPHYDEVEAIIRPRRYPFEDPPYRHTPKTDAFQKAAETVGVDWHLPELAVTFGNEGERPIPGEPIEESVRNLHDRTRYTCRLVGECDVGCNFGSKNSLDYNYLTLASRLHGAELRTRCEVRSFAPRPGGGYVVSYVEHVDENEGRQTDTGKLPQVEIAAKRLIVSAGTLGTPFLFLRNRAAFPRLSDSLGTHFSGNGDLLTFSAHARKRLNGEQVQWIIEPSFGPVITSTIRVDDTADGGSGPGYYIQEGGYPAFLSWMQESLALPGEVSRVSRFVLRRLWDRLTAKPHSDISAELSKVIGNTERSATLLPMLGMGRDTPDGVMSLRDGFLEVDWRTEGSEAYFDRVRATMRALTEALGGQLQEKPLWRFMRVITVHPLGGCPMGHDESEGFVDPFGRVFGYPGLHVADGSVMPGPVGPNPSFTIAALADRFADAILDEG